MTGETQPAAATANVAAAGTTITEQSTTAATNTPPSEGGEGGTTEPATTDAQQPPAAGDTPATDDTGAKDETPAEDVGAPEGDYADFTVPEGMVLDGEATTAFKELAKTANLSQVGAQKLIDMASAQVAKTMEGFQQQASERVAQWAEQAKVDPVVGGPKYAENVQVALDAVTKFGDPELKEAFEEFGLGNHPAFVRAFYRIGKAMGEGGFVHGQGNEQPAKSANPEVAMAQRMAAEQARNPVAKKLST